MKEPVKQFKGVERHEEVESSQRRDDTRTLYMKISDALETETGTFVFFSSLAGFTILTSFIPGLGEVAVGMAALVYMTKYSYTRRSWTAPFRVPAYLKKVRNTTYVDASTGKAGMGQIYLGHEINTGKEVWSTFNDVKTHRIVIGTTGSGKTEEILGNIFNFLVVDSGAMLVDGKSDPKTFDSLLRICRVVGREEDILILNYIMGGRDFGAGMDNKRSNTFNPLSMGSSAQKSELMQSLMSSGSGGDDMWRGRAVSFLDGVIPPLNFLSDKGYVLFNVGLLCDFYLLENIENLLWFGIFKDLNGHIVDLKNGDNVQRRHFKELKTNFCGALELYIRNLPGYMVPDKPHKPVDMTQEMIAYIEKTYANRPVNPEEQKQANAKAKSFGDTRPKVLEQHGYITMQLVRAAGDLRFNYGHIYNAQIGEIAFRDVMLNRRIAHVLLPSLERSSMDQLGKMAVSSIKSVLAVLLDSPLEGDRREIIEGRASNSPVPFGVVLDEYGYYVQMGFAVAAAQARSYNVSLTFGVQDYTSLTKANKNEGEATWENTNLRHAGRMTGGEKSETYEKIAGAAGQVEVQQTSTMAYNRGALDSFRVDGNSNLVKINRVSSDDLIQQQDGEFHLIVGRKSSMNIKGAFSKSGSAVVVRYLAFYTGNVPTPNRLRLVHYVQVKPFSESERDHVSRNEIIAEKLSRTTPEALTLSILSSSEGGEIDRDIIAEFVKAARADGFEMPLDDIRGWIRAYNIKQLRREQVDVADKAVSGLTEEVEIFAANAGVNDEIVELHRQAMAGLLLQWQEYQLEHEEAEMDLERMALSAGKLTAKAHAGLVALIER